MSSRSQKQYVWFVLASSLALSLGAQAAEESSNPLTINGRIWARYFYDLTKDSAHANGFNLYRTYLSLNYKMDDTWSGTLLFDGPSSDSLSTSATTNTVPAYVRNAFVQATNLWEGKGTFRFGLQPTLYIATIDNTTKTRWLGRSLADQAGINPSQSTGAGVMGNIGNFVKYGALIHNGREGLNALQSDQDSGLSYSFIATFSPFAESDNEFAKKIGVTVYDDLRAAGKSAPATIIEQGSNLLALALHGQSAVIDWAAEMTMQKPRGTITNSRTGYGFTANVKFMEEKVSLYGRYFTGNDEFKTRTLTRKSLLTVGPTYSFVKDKLATAILYETRASLDNATGSAANADNKLYWNWAFNF